MKIGIIGLGRMGNIHLRNYLSLGCKVVALADLKDISKIGKEVGCNTFEDYKDLLEEDLDAVSVCTPTTTHFEVAKDCLEAGKHVLVEKPITNSIEKARKLVKIAKRNDRKLMVGHVERYNPVVMKCKEIMKENEIQSMFARRVGLSPPRFIDSGVILDLAIHDIDVMRFLVGEVRDVKSIISDGKYENDAFVLLKFENGVNGCIQVNWLTPYKERTLTLTGVSGVYNVNYMSQEIEFLRTTIKEKYKNFNQFLKELESYETIKIPIERKEPIFIELQEFINCIKEDREPLTSGKEGLKNLEIALSALKK